MTHSTPERSAPNGTIATLLSHRSIRKYKPDPIPDEHIRQAVRCGQAASTSSAIQAYCALHVTDAAKRNRLVELTGGQPKVAQCGAFFVVCADTRRHRLTCRRAGKPYDTKMEAFLLGVIDASLFAQNMALALESMGYGICYIGGLRNDLPAVDELLEVPHGIYPLFGLCAGLPDESPAERLRFPVDAVLYRDAWPSDEEIQVELDAYDAAYSAYLEARGAGAEKARHAWTGPMTTRFANPQRVTVGSYYRSKGADVR